jgi:hypothetical protein
MPATIYLTSAIEAPDHGMVPVTLRVTTPPWVLGQKVRVGMLRSDHAGGWVSPPECYLYSGVAGQSTDLYPSPDDSTMPYYLELLRGWPALLAPDEYMPRVEYWNGGAWVLATVTGYADKHIHVMPRSRYEEIYRIRQGFPAPPYDDAGMREAWSEPMLDAPGAAADKASTESLLAALTGTLGDEMARLLGRPTTRLRQALNLSATTIHVESTYGFPTSGNLNVNGEVISYTGKTSTTFTGCTRSIDRYALCGEGQPDQPVNAPVYDSNRRWGLRDRAVNDYTAERANGDRTMMDGMALDRLAVMRGFPRPLEEMTAIDMKRYEQAQWYLDRGPWWAAFRVLEGMFGWAMELPAAPRHLFTGHVDNLGGTLWLHVRLQVDATWDLSCFLDRWIWLGDRERLCRIKAIQYDGAVGAYLLLYDTDGPRHQAHDLASRLGVNVEWAILPFRFVQEGTYDSSGILVSAGSLTVLVYATDSSLPFTYIMLDDTALITDSRPVAGKIMANWTTPGFELGRLKAPLYALDPFRPITIEVLRTVVPSGVHVDVVVLPV